MLSFRTPRGVFNYRAAAVLLDRGAVLVHRAPDDAFWSLPGGRVEFGEDSCDALRRELLEEIGLGVEVGRLLFVVENFFDVRDPHHEIGFYYEVAALGELPREQEFLGRAEDRDPRLVFRWQPLEELGSVRLYPRFLVEALRRPTDATTHVIQREA